MIVSLYFNVIELFQGADGIYLNVLMKIFQEKTRTDLPLPSYGSVGPIRRIRNKFGSESRPRKSIFLNSPNASSPLEKVGASKLFLPAAAGKNLEVGQTSGLEKYQSVDHRVGTSEEPMPLISSSNDAVRKILEQLDRHKPTPAEKAAELKLASKWKKYPGKEISDSTPNDKMKSSHLGDFGIRMNNGLAAAQSSKEGDNGTVNRVEIHQEQTTRGTDTGTDASTKAASIANVLGTTAKANTVPPFTSKAADSQVKSFFSGSHNPSLRKVCICYWKLPFQMALVCTFLTFSSLFLKATSFTCSKFCLCIRGWSVQKHRPPGDVNLGVCC